MSMFETKRSAFLGRPCFGVQVGLALMVLAGGAMAQHYPNGRRGDGSGYWPDARVPLKWDAESGTNIRWKAQLKTRGSNGTPVFGPGRVLVLSEPDYLQCFSTEDLPAVTADGTQSQTLQAGGRLLWETRFSSIDVTVPEEKRDEAREAILKHACAFWKLRPVDEPELAKLADLGRKSPDYNDVARRAGKLGAYRLRPGPKWPEAGLTAITPCATKDRVVVGHGSHVIGCYSWDGELIWATQTSTSKKFGLNGLWHMGAVVIIPAHEDVPDLVVCHATPTPETMGISEEEYKANKYPAPGKGKNDFGIDQLMAYELAGGKLAWRSDVVRHGIMRTTPIATTTVDGMPILLTGGASVIRARDGKVLLPNLAWNGYGNNAGFCQDPDDPKATILVYNEGCRREVAPRWGHHVRAFRLRRKGDTLTSEQLWEWGYDNPKIHGAKASSPVIADGRVFIGGGQGYVFDLMSGEVQVGPPEASVEAARQLGRNGWWRRRPWIRQHTYLNPIVVGDHVFLAQADGAVAIYETALKPLDDDDPNTPPYEPTLLRINRIMPKSKRRKPPLPNWVIATPVVWEDCLYIRQNAWLWCVGK